MTMEPEQPADFTSLYRQAFAQYGTRALWNKRLLEKPTPEDALVVARALRIEGDRAARRLAEGIEEACRWSVDLFIGRVCLIQMPEQRLDFGLKRRIVLTQARQIDPRARVPRRVAFEAGRDPKARRRRGEPGVQG